MVIKIEILSTLKYFEGLSDDELEPIQKYMVEKSVSKGEVFVVEDERSEYLYFLIEGMVKVYKSLNNGKEQILHIAPPGEALNDTAAYDGGLNIGSMMALTPVTLYGLPKKYLFTVLEKNPKIYLNVLKALAYRTRRDANLVKELSFAQVMERLAKLILGEYAGEKSSVGLWLTQQDMANMIGTRREVVNRSLKIMEENGAIKLARHRVIIVNKRILEEMSSPDTVL
jgi:CRP-like cAMP-binding protein